MAKNSPHRDLVRPMRRSTRINQARLLVMGIAILIAVYGVAQQSSQASPKTRIARAALSTFSPTASTYTTAQTVTISDSTAGAVIYYTADGSTPTTSSRQYSGGIVLSQTTTIKAMATASGKSNSAIATATYTISSQTSQLMGNSLNYGSGFTASGLTLNGGAAISGGFLQLTDGGSSEARSTFFNTPVNVQSFTNDFSFQLTNAEADGFTFTIQGQSATAIGRAGGGLGYRGIGLSAAIKFDLYDNAGEGPDSTGLFTNGAYPTVPASDLSGSGVDLHSGDVMNVHMTYDGTTLTWTITDATAGTRCQNSATVNIPSLVGANTAYVGFTAGTGGLTATQDILTWTYVSGVAPSNSAIATTSTVNLPQITTSALPAGAVGVTYSTALTATSGVTPYTWSVVSGQLPPGLSLQASTGQIVGIPSQAGTFSLSVQVKDSSNQTASASFSVNVAPAASPIVPVTNPGSAISHYLYAISPGPVVTVYDIDNKFEQIKQISAGTSTAAIRGAVASAVGGFLYMSYGCTSASACTPYLMKYDLGTDTVVWNNTFPAGIDSHSISPDGSTIYMPTGEGDYDHSLWYTIDTSNGNVTGTIDSGITGPHNTIVSSDGGHIYMGGIGQDTNGDGQNHVVRANATDGSIAGRIGPFNETRPFTIDAAEQYAFVTPNGLNGFQVGSIATGDILYTASVAGFDNSNCNQYVSCSHGISLSPDGNQIYVVDYYNNYVHVFDVSGLPSSAPAPVADIALNHAYAGSGAWLTHSRDGNFVFVGQSGDVIDTTTQQIVGYIPALSGTKVYTEIDFQNGAVSFTPLSRSGVGYAK